MAGGRGQRARNNNHHALRKWGGLPRKVAGQERKRKATVRVLMYLEDEIKSMK